MMKLNKLYCNDKRFHNIDFNPGMNIVLGKVTRKYDMQIDSHNLGKSTLITLLDFMLLDDLTTEHIFKRFINVFSHHVFYLEVCLHDNKYLTICRNVAEPTKISFKSSENSIVCSETTIWDVTNLPFEKAKSYLNDILNFEVLPEYSYRKTVSFFLRHQEDYNNVFQLGKYMKGKYRDWKPFVFKLLGYDNNNLIEKYDIEQQLKDILSVINANKWSSIKAEDYSKIQSTLEIKKIERQEMQERIDSFNFYAEERSLNHELIENIERDIAELNSKEYALAYDLDKTKQSIENIPTFNIAQLKEIYEEVNVYFPDNIAHSYEDLLKFNTKVIKERNHYLREQIANIETELKTTRERLENLNNKRNNTLTTLQDKDTFHKFKEYQRRLAQLEGEISRLTLQLQNIDEITILNEKADNLRQQIKDVGKKIISQVKTQNDFDTQTLKKLFNEIFHTVFDKSALLYVKANSESNVEFCAEVALNEESEKTAESKGHTYNKMMCVAFDLAVLATYSNRAYFHFTYHDGVLEGLDNRKKELFLQIARTFCKKYNIQYIFSTIDDDIPTNLLSQFSNRERCLELNDKDDYGKLFGFSF